MDRMTALVKAVEQAVRQQQTTLKRKTTQGAPTKSRTKKPKTLKTSSIKTPIVSKPIAERVIVVRFDPDLTEGDRGKFRAFLEQAHRAGVPVYMHHPTHKWKNVFNFFGLNPEERIVLIKGFFEHDDVSDMKRKIKDIEKTPLARIHNVRTIREAQQQLV